MLFYYHGFPLVVKLQWIRSKKNSTVIDIYTTGVSSQMMSDLY